MEFIVVSDNHGKTAELEAILALYPNAAGFIHCGDSEMNPKDLTSFHVVTGNNDYYYTFPDELVVDFEGVRIYFTHSHKLRFGKTIEDLVARAKAKNCTIACYGHTHRFDDSVVDGIQIINPGSLYYNRDGSQPSYARVVVDAGKITVEKLFARDL
ncbi:YfcE family phosphodiesterase [Erysipelothrix sp. HDW6C]|uniref:metallophosphoesterase family protein n=1 Tax=Erysipelothrix sp. HDW6C TaxID=2714930 RepID=UPI00140AC173|nr:YfcE family phosphodiesterase [Erysipelothrix sp. HDW6C]QIK69885.1 YfcE family phosphodiesterase [Erysipelothrix sp. HDW6C]